MGMCVDLSTPLCVPTLTTSHQGTWFYDGLGACGYYNTNSDPIVAISAQIYGTGGSCNLVSVLSRAMPVSHVVL